MSALIVIPARFASTRLPGKPLIRIAGKALVARVAGIAARASARVPGTAWVVATDHTEIAAFCAAEGLPVVMTPVDVPTGSDRVLAAADALGSNADLLLNLQGDSPFTPVNHIVAMLEAAQTVRADCITPVVQLEWDALDGLREHKKLAPFSGTTCVRAADGRAYWFSKNVLPAIRNEAKLRAAGPVSPVWRHVGLYAYTRGALARFCALPESPMERLEGLEQLRFLENGMVVHTVEVAAETLAMGGVDTPEDVKLAEDLIARHGDPEHG